MKAGAYEYDDDGEKGGAGGNKKANGLPVWGNEKTMNLNPLILTNIQSSQYFKVNLYQLKTYHEVIDEIYYNVSHLEPWEKGSRKTSGQTGMCGGVRGVGAGGIVSTAFCILYKLYTLRLTRKQVVGLLNHADSPYIRGLGFMYIRYTQPPADLWDWFEGYLDDEEEIDVRAGGGQTTSVGQMVRHMLSKLDWYSTLFPRIPVPIQKDLEKKLAGRDATWQPPQTPQAPPQTNATAPNAQAPNAAAPGKDWYGGGSGGRQDPDPNRDSVTNKGYDGREKAERETERGKDSGREYERERGTRDRRGEREERDRDNRGGRDGEREERERDRDREERDRDRGGRDGDREERDRDRGGRDGDREERDRDRGGRDGDREERDRDRGRDGDREERDRDRGGRDGDREERDRDRGGRDGDREERERDRGGRDGDREERERDRGGRDGDREERDRDRGGRDGERRSRGPPNERNGEKYRHRRDKERSKRSRSRSYDKRHRHRGDHRDFADLLEREKHRIKKEKKTEGSRERHHRSRSREREREKDRDRRHRY